MNTMEQALGLAPDVLRKSLQSHLHGDELYKIPFLREMQVREAMSKI